MDVVDLSLVCLLEGLECSCCEGPSRYCLYLSDHILRRLGLMVVILRRGLMLTPVVVSELVILIFLHVLL